MIPIANVKSSRQSKPYDAISNLKSHKKNLELKETELGYHYELKIPGYIKEDFRFYISRNQLVVTTEKSKTETNLFSNKNHEKSHSYCYPSALFKMKIPLPKKPVEKRITVEYRNEILHFSLYKI